MRTLPHWELDERARTTEQKSTKTVKTLLYQAKMVRRMDALLVSSEQERQDILKLGWTKRIDIVQDSVLNSSLGDDDMAQQTISFYRKVLDTRYQFAMTAMEKDAIPSLLHAGLAQETTHNLLPSDQLLNLRSLNPEQWRRIFLIGVVTESLSRHGLVSYQLLCVNRCDSKSVTRWFSTRDNPQPLAQRPTS